jgi:hypothetical protein
VAGAKVDQQRSPAHPVLFLLSLASQQENNHNNSLPEPDDSIASTRRAQPKSLVLLLRSILVHPFAFLSFLNLVSLAQAAGHHCFFSPVGAHNIGQCLLLHNPHLALT